MYIVSSIIYNIYTITIVLHTEYVEKSNLNLEQAYKISSFLILLY